MEENPRIYHGVQPKHLEKCSVWAGIFGDQVTGSF